MVAVPLLDPDIVITNFTFLPRREFIDVNGFENRYMPSEIKPLDNPAWIPYAFESLKYLTSPHDDLINAFLALQARRLSLLELRTNDLNIGP